MSFRISFILKVVCYTFFFAAATMLSASDEAAADAFTKGRAAEDKDDYSTAADHYNAAKIYADDPQLKANALLSAARAYRKEQLHGKEFDVLETLIQEHLPRIDFARVVDRQYRIADAYFAGYRDPLLSWLPFIKKENRSIEMYEKALRNAPLADRSPNARLRLAHLYLDEGQTEDALREFKETINLYPETQAARYAMLALADTYLQLSRRGDGDGANAQQAIEILDEFLAKYPNDPEVSWAKRGRAEIDSIMAKRLYGLGRYHQRRGEIETAKRYYSEAIRKHGGTEDAKPSEQALAKIDNYTPPADDAPRKELETPAIERFEIPDEKRPIMVVPENSGGKWLFPVRDLRGDVRQDSRFPTYNEPEKVSTND